jgi:hypothetical protein
MSTNTATATATAEPTWEARVAFAEANEHLFGDLGVEGEGFAHDADRLVAAVEQVERMGHEGYPVSARDAEAVRAAVEVVRDDLARLLEALDALPR